MPNPTITELLPKFISILEEGDVAYRMATLLRESGWTSDDWWQAYKGHFVPEALRNNIANYLRDMEKSFPSTKHSYPGAVEDLKATLKKAKTAK